MKTNARLNELMQNVSAKNLRAAMKEFGDVNDAFCGVNENGETVIVSVCPDSIIITTHQSNGWVRNNYYDEDGYFAGTSYDGRWDR